MIYIISCNINVSSTLLRYEFMYVFLGRVTNINVNYPEKEIKYVFASEFVVDIQFVMVL